MPSESSPSITTVNDITRWRRGSTMVVRLPIDIGWEPALLVIDLERMFKRLRKKDPFAGPFDVIFGRKWKKVMKLRFYKGIGRPKLNTSLLDRLEQMEEIREVFLDPFLEGYNVRVTEP